jgi:hypothetical protein
VPLAGVPSELGWGTMSIEPVTLPIASVLVRGKRSISLGIAYARPDPMGPQTGANF